MNSKWSVFLLENYGKESDKYDDKQVSVLKGIHFSYVDDYHKWVHSFVLIMKFALINGMIYGLDKAT